MSAKLATHRKGDVIIIDTSGKVTLGEGASTLRLNIRELVTAGSRKIILNMAEVTYLDSSGLGELLAAHTTVSNAGGAIKLLNLSKRVRDILELTRLDSVFETFEDEALAVDSFSVAAGITDQGGAGKAGEVLLWLLQIVTAAAFFAAAVPKLTGSPAMVELFERIGLGQWFRYFTGVLETIGALLLLIPGFAAAGALLLAVVMAGAIVTHLAILGTSPAHAVEFLVLAVLVAWFRRGQVRAHWVALLLAAFCCSVGTAGAQPNMPPSILKAPANWRFERMPTPPGFAPDIQLSGFEEARFSPGMFDNSAPDYFTYVLVISADKTPAIDSAALKDFLEKYYRGLSVGLGQRKGLSPDPAQMNAEVNPVQSDKDYYSAKVTFFDSFTDGRKITLNIAARVLARPAAKKTGLVLLISPQPKDHAVWQTLREIEGKIEFTGRE